MPPDIWSVTFKLKNKGLDIPRNFTTKVHKTDFIVWSLKPNSGLDSFKIKIKPEDSVLFITPPHQNGDIWSAEINHNVDSADCKYDIVYWKAHDTTAYSWDPIISIKPSITLSTMEMPFFIVFVFLGAVGFWGTSFFKKWASKRNSASS